MSKNSTIVLKYQKALRKYYASKDNKGPVFLANNDDIETVPDFRANFSKSFPHNEQGNVDKVQYNKFIKAIKNLSPNLMHEVQLGTPPDQGGLTLVSADNIFFADFIGKYAGSYDFPAAPSISSAELAADEVEVYEFALARDVPFINYSSSPDIATACAELNLLSAYSGPVDPSTGTVTPNVIFRGNSAGDLVGPYISQFLLLPVAYGPALFDQKFVVPQPGVVYQTSLNTFLSAYNGKVIENVGPNQPNRKYLYNLAGLAAYVHSEPLYEETFNAALILTKLGVPYSPGNPYVNGTIINQ